MLDHSLGYAWHCSCWAHLPLCLGRQRAPAMRLSWCPCSPHSK